MKHATKREISKVMRAMQDRWMKMSTPQQRQDNARKAVNKRWENATKEERLATGQRLLESRKLSRKTLS